MRLNPTGNWLPYVPSDDDVQVSGTQDFFACASYSAIHIAETLVKFQTGHFWDFSARALAKLSNTTKQGNYIGNIVTAIKTYGLLLDTDWPQLTDSDTYPPVDWNTYYEPLPMSAVKKAYPFTVDSFRKLTSMEVDEALKAGPLWTIIDLGWTNHIVMQINKTQYFDSYEIRIKNFQPAQPIVSQYQLLLIPKLMTNARLVKNGSEYGFYLPAVNEQELIGKALNFGLPLPTTDNGSKVDWPNVKPDIVIQS